MLFCAGYGYAIFIHFSIHIFVYPHINIFGLETAIYRIRQQPGSLLVQLMASSLFSAEWCLILNWTYSLHWRHNDHDGVSNHQPHGCLHNRLLRRKSKKTSKLRVTGLCVWNSPGPLGQLRGKCFHLMTSSCQWNFNVEVLTFVEENRYLQRK